MMVAEREGEGFSASGGYGGVDSAGGPPPDPAETSSPPLPFFLSHIPPCPPGINSAGPSGPPANGGGFNIFRRAGKPDKAPLLNSDREGMMRSLSGGDGLLPSGAPAPPNLPRGRRDGLNTFSGVRPS